MSNKKDTISSKWIDKAEFDALNEFYYNRKKFENYINSSIDKAIANCAKFYCSEDDSISKGLIDQIDNNERI